MEQWQKNFEDFMNNVGAFDDIGFFTIVGKKDRRIAKVIMDFVEKHNFDTFGMWEEDSGEKYHKYVELMTIVLDLRKKYGQNAITD